MEIGESIKTDLRGLIELLGGKVEQQNQSEQF